MTDMQDRIKELAKQCGAVSDFLALGRHDGILFSTLELERFAQAIARECAKAVDEELTNGRSPMGRVAANAIRARFGIAGE